MKDTTKTTPDCRVVGCFYERNKSRAGLLPCEQGFSGTPELCEATFRHCALRIQAAYETILTDEIKKERFQMTDKPVTTPKNLKLCVLNSAESLDVVANETPENPHSAIIRECAKTFRALVKHLPDEQPILKVVS